MAMRTAFALLPLLMAAVPVAAAAPQQQSQPYLPPQLSDPAMVDRLAGTMQAMSRAFLDLPVGEIEAAVEGRPPTPADRNRTLRSEDPNFDREVQTQIARARPMIRQSMKAISDALPAVMKSLHDARESIERAAANMPDPNYPKR
jgi:hypothetical protein